MKNFKNNGPQEIKEDELNQVNGGVAPYCKMKKPQSTLAGTTLSSSSVSTGLADTDIKQNTTEDAWG